MKNDALYKGVSSLLKPNDLFNRPRIMALFASAQDKPLLGVVAPGGFGKTYAVSSYLQSKQKNVVWMQLSFMDNIPARFWEHFTYSIGVSNPELAAKMSVLELPENTIMFNSFVQLMAAGISEKGPVYLVMDDFHLITEPAVINWVNNIVQAEIQGLKLALISRQELPVNTLMLTSKNKMLEITQEDLRFTPEEISEYFQNREVLLSDKAVQDICNISDGWIIAIYLIYLSLTKKVKYDKLPALPIHLDVLRLIDTELFVGFTPELKQLLVKMSLLVACPGELVKYLCSGHSAQLLEDLNQTAFINYDVHSGNYHIHGIFLEYLHSKIDLLTEQEQWKLHYDAAVWFAEHKYSLEAITHFEKVGCYMEIVKTVRGLTSTHNAVVHLAREALERAPDELYASQPIFYVVEAVFLLQVLRLEEALAILEPLREKYEMLEPTPERNEMLGEIYNALAFISLIVSFEVPVYNFVDYYIKADKYLPEGSNLLGENLHLNKGTFACMIHVNNAEKGSFERLEKAMCLAMPYAAKVMRGCGYGIEYLVMTERAYYCKDIKAAQKHALQAIYKSRKKGQFDIEVMAMFYLIRMQVCLCNYEELKQLLERFRQLAASLNNTDCYSMLHIAEGWFYTSVGCPEKVEPWIMDESNDLNEFKKVSFCLYHFVRAKSYLADKKYYELLAFLEQHNDQWGLQNFLLGAIEINVLKAIALYRLHEKEESFSVLHQAYILAYPNAIVMPFIEYGTHMRTLAQAAIADGTSGIPAEWLEEICVKASSYSKKIQHIAAKFQKEEGESEPETTLTGREKEVLKQLCYGLTQKEIADECDLSVNTVKSVLQNIYKKLGAFNSYNAISIAAKLGIDV